MEYEYKRRLLFTKYTATQHEYTHKKIYIEEKKMKVKVIMYEYLFDSHSTKTEYIKET